MKIIDYHQGYKPACLLVFRSNLDTYFDDSEEGEYELFLNRLSPKTHYFVVLNDDEELVACGGYGPDGEVMKLCWGMVRRDCHGQSIGSRLVEHRLEHIAKTGGGRVLMDTSQHTQGFYQKHGFKVIKTVSNGYGDGLDRVFMEVVVEGV